MKQTWVLALLLGSVAAYDNGLGQVPQMGWNTWNKFACDISEDLVKQTADQLVDMGLDKLGYKFINLDDCWQQVDRDEHGHVQIDPKFPSGMKALGDYLHDKGLKFGLYSSAGTLTCQKRAGGLGYEVEDAADYASWGVDYLKYDNCHNQKVPGTKRYTAMRDALNATGRPIFYSLCNWGEEDVANWGPETANSWRTTMDIFDGWGSIEYNFKANMKVRDSAGVGGWNDPDMLEIGNGGLTHEEEKSHFALWAISKAPLIIGCDLTTVEDASLQILTNEEIIAVNQDAGSEQGRCVVGCSWWDELLRRPSVYATRLSSGQVAAVAINWRETTYSNLRIDLTDLGVAPKDGAWVTVRDLFAKEDISSGQDFNDQAYIEIKSLPGHGSRMFLFTVAEDEE